jgi:hypothetical protein
MVSTEAQKRASAVWREKNPDVNRQRAREGLRKNTKAMQAIGNIKELRRLFIIIPNDRTPPANFWYHYRNQQRIFRQYFIIVMILIIIKLKKNDKNILLRKDIKLRI